MSGSHQALRGNEGLSAQSGQMVDQVQPRHRFPVEPSTSNHMAGIQSAKEKKIPRRSEIELLIYGARTSLSAAAKNRLGEILRENLNWNEVIEMASRHAVMPLLNRNLNLCSHLVPAEVLAQFRVLTVQTSIQNLYRAAELNRLVEMMARNGIASLPFKGPVLAFSAYGDLSLRQFSDLDILIHKKDIQKAKNLFVERGYAPLGDRTVEQEEVFLKARRPYNYKFISADGQVSIELHWEFTSRYNSFPMDYEALFKRLTPIDFAGQQVLQLKPEDLILLLCQHGSKHFWTRLLWLYDIVEVIRRYPALDWKKTITQAESMGARRMLFFGLHLAEALLDLELPVEVSKRIRKEPKIKSLLARIEEQLFLESRDIQGFERHKLSCSMRERLRDKFRYAGYRLLHWVSKVTTPSEKDRDALPQGTRSLPLAYLVRPVRLLGDGFVKVVKPVAKESARDMISFGTTQIRRAIRPLRETTSGIQVFSYHGIVEQRVDPRLERNFHLLSDFKRHIDFLRRFEVIGIDQIVEAQGSSASTRRLMVAITFDDGYANNLIAAELLEKAGLPWSVFVSTGTVGAMGATWNAELSLLILHGRATHIEVLEKKWSLKNRVEREIAFQEIRFPLKEMPANAKMKCMESIRAQFPEGETDSLLRKFPSLQMLSWDQIRHFNPSKVIVGSHGVNHEIHHRNQDKDVRRFELLRSRMDLERELTRPCKYFAYPNGNSHHLSSSEVEAAGYDLAFTLKPGTIQREENPFLLPRFTAPASLDSLQKTIYGSAL